jgi:hypothetical protein
MVWIVLALIFVYGLLATIYPWPGTWDSPYGGPV